MISFMNSNTPEMASYRYRTLIPAQQLGADINNPDAEILVFGKPNSVKEVRVSKDQGKKVIVDFCDDHFDHPSLGEIYRRVARLADVITCPTDAMYRRLSDLFDEARIFVIRDPYEMPEHAPHANGERLLWFGHNVNLKDVWNSIVFFKNVTVVSGPKAQEPIIQWSPENLDREMRNANIALFPTTKEHYYKSPNRLVNALRMGLFPVCDVHPAYNEFRDFVWMSDVRTGVKWAREFKHELNDLVLQGQDYIRHRYSPETIGKRWEEVLSC